VVKSDIYLRSAHDITGLDEVWQEHFPTDPPARSLFVVDSMALEDGVIEINHIAQVRGSKLKRQTIETARAPRPLFYEPQAVKVGPLLFLSTQLAHDAGGLAADARSDPQFPHLGSPGRLQGEVLLRNIDAICHAAGGSLRDVARLQLHFTDLGQLDATNEVLKRSFPADPPALTVVAVKGPLPVDGAVLMGSAIAYLDE
jgi:enamine deaminase RidA (YjgF/YER057c/UK114 family)